MITVHNTLSGKKEPVIFKDPLRVTLYVCGITPYDYSHLGHARCYVSFDLLYRLLSFLGYNVIYTRNFTDIDDKLLIKAQEYFGDQFRYPEIAQKYIEAYTQEMEALGCLKPQHEPKVTDHIPEIIAFIQGLIENNTAYVADGDVYFRISAFPEYGKLSKQKIDELRAGARVEVNELKEDPLDFALWKGEEEGTFWDSPWGWGRPGWHIECSALAYTYLGKHVDIHAGGADLIFPHHENEIAQSEGLFHTYFVRYWMHNGFIRINQEKMSKSLGNAFSLKDIFKQVDPMVLRFYLLNHHYRSPLDFSLPDVEIARKNYQKLCTLFASVDPVPLSASTIKKDGIVQKMLAALCDDLNSTSMIGILFEHLRTIAENKEQAGEVKAFLMNVMGLRLEPLAQQEIVYTQEIKDLLAQREQARTAKDWARADAIRDQLQQLGVAVHDKKM